MVDPRAHGVAPHQAGIAGKFPAPDFLSITRILICSSDAFCSKKTNHDLRN
jgi:hypothetical protein